MLVVHFFILLMKNLEELKIEYLNQLEPIRKRREALQAGLKGTNGKERDELEKRINGLYRSEQSLLYSLSQIQASIDGKTKC